MTKRKTRAKRVSRKRSSSVSVPSQQVKITKSRIIIITSLILILIITAYALTLHFNALKRADIRIGDCLVRVEIANTHQSQEKGLGGRKHLKTNHGMLFVFDYLRRQSFWMKDTHIPLSIAFISSEGKILQIEQMEPLDLDIVTSHSPVRYALEVNKGFFQENGITVGMHVDLSDVLNR